jgi:hypothetical protein
VADDPPRLLEQVVSDVEAGDARQGSAGTAAVFDGSIASALAAPSFIAKSVLAVAVLGVGGSPGSEVGSVRHLIRPPSRRTARPAGGFGLTPDGCLG